MPSLNESRSLVTFRERDGFFAFSASLFRVGLALVSFEQVRPFAIQISDYCFFLSLLLLLLSPKFRLPRAITSEFTLAASFVLIGAMSSSISAPHWTSSVASLGKLIALYALFAPLATIHSGDLRKNLLFLAGGALGNSLIALIQAWVFPGLADRLSINPVTPDLSVDIGRFQALTSHPNLLGLCAAMAVLIGIGFFSMGNGWRLRRNTLFLITVCIFAVLLSGSRNSLVALLSGLLVFLLCQKRRWGVIGPVLVALAFLAALISYATPGLVTTLSDRFESSGDVLTSDYYRFLMANYAIDEIESKPLVGWGAQHFGEAGIMLIPGTDQVLGAHNSLLQYWYGAGILGAVGFLLVFFVPGLRLLQSLWRTPLGHLRDLLSLCLGCLVLLFVVSNFHPFLYERFLYVPPFLFLGFVTRLRSADLSRC